MIVTVNRARPLLFRWATAWAIFAGLALACAAPRAQAQNPSSAFNSFFGSVTTQPASDETLKLSLDGAIALGLKNNLGLKEAEYGEKSFKGQKNETLQNFLPTITLAGDTGVHQQNLVALGFGPNVVKLFTPLFPGGVVPPGFSFITRDELTEGKIQFSQILFSSPVIAGWKAAGAAQRAAYFTKMYARAEVVQQVASAYLHAIAASSEVDNAKALEAADQVLLAHVHAAHEAGTAANLDELRARVQLLAQQQALIVAQNALEKTSSCSSAKSASTPARRSRSLIRRPIANWPPKPRKKSWPSLTETARTTRTCKIKPSSTRPSTPPTAASGCPPSALAAITASARSAPWVRTATLSPRAPSAFRSFAKPNCAAM